MKTRRVIVQFEIETNVPVADMQKATIRVSSDGPWSIRYLEKNRVNIVRASTAKRVKAKKVQKEK